MITDNVFMIFLLLVFGHALADYPLQGDFLSKAKNHKAPIPGVPWWQALAAHSVIHAGFVGMITGSITFAAAEFVIHAYTDHKKCEGGISYNFDQGVHIACKVMWALGIASFVVFP